MSKSTLDKLLEQRNRVWEQVKALADTAADENRNFTAEEQQTYERQNADLDAYAARMTTLIDEEKRGQAFDKSMADLQGSPVDVRNTPDTNKSDELRGFLAGNGQRSYTVRPDGPIDFRALGKSVQGAITTSGAAAVPVSFYARLMEHLTENAAVLSAGPTVLNTTSGEELQIPKTTAHGSAAIVAEGAAIAEADSTFAQVSLRSFKYGRLVKLSRELVTDKAVDLEGYLARDSGRALGNAFGAHLVTGTGTTQPRGVLTDATLGLTAPAGVIANFGSQSVVGQGGDLFIDLFHSVISPYRNSSSCGWLMRDATAAMVRKLKNSQGDYIWQPGLTAGDPDTILAKPVYFDPTMPAVAASAKSVLFGDLSTYFVRLVGGVTYERSDDFAFDRDLVTFRALMRADAALVDLTGAVKYLAHPAS